ncbi:hypothetical protein HRR86_000250 [Exophiala dermatitidis]|nr:hypothetical protein HRR86_000250 [Exophiala dermatitidis]KAJ4647859.1 hypothetical protein HRR89_001030 [Exophiala dermatitidis]
MFSLRSSLLTSHNSGTMLTGDGLWFPAHTTCQAHLAATLHRRARHDPYYLLLVAGVLASCLDKPSPDVDEQTVQVAFHYCHQHYCPFVLSIRIRRSSFLFFSAVSYYDTSSGAAELSALSQKPILLIFNSS